MRGVELAEFMRMAASLFASAGWHISATVPGVTDIRGLPGCDGTGVSLNAAPTPSFDGGAPPGRGPRRACTYGTGFRLPSSAAFLGGGGLLLSAAGSAGSADAGRGGSPSSRFAFSNAESLLMRTFRAMRECWLVRRGVEFATVGGRRSCVCGVPAAMVIGRAAMLDRLRG